HAFAEDFAGLIHARTEGNPLFVHNLLDFVVSRSLVEQKNGGWILSAAFRDVDFTFPESLSETIETQIERLTDKEQALLETARAAGTTFAVPLIAGPDPDTAASAAECCEQMARRNLFLRPRRFSGGERMAAEYQFAHALYRDVFYRRVSPLRRVRLHQVIGERLEKMSAGRITEAAAELAAHFQQSRDHARAIRYLALLAQRSAARHALLEAVD